MNRRGFLVSTGAMGGVLLAGCASAGPSGAAPSGGGGQTGGTGVEPTPTVRPTTATPQPTPVGTATPTPIEDLSVPTIRSTGSGVGTSDRFAALGGPVIVTLRFDYAGMKNSNFIVRAVDETGETLLPSVLAVNELFEPTQSETTDEYTARLVTHFEPGEYFIDVTHAGGPYGNGDWEVTIEQPGVPTTGQALPLTVDGYDSDAIGPVTFDGPARVSLETLEPRLSFDGSPSTYNYQVRPTDALGRPGDLVINSLGPAPESLSAVWFPGDVTVGYVNVHSFGPWRATVAGA